MDRRAARRSLAITAAISLVALAVAAVAAILGAWIFAAILLVLAIPFRSASRLRELFAAAFR